MSILRLGFGNLNTDPDWVTVADLLDRTRVYTVPSAGGDTPSRQRDISAICEAPCSPIGQSAVLKKSRLAYWTRTYTLFFKSTPESYESAKENREAVKKIIDAGRAAQQGAACVALGLGTDSGAPLVYLIRQINDEIYPTVWTLLDGECIPIDEEYSGINIIGMKLELLIMEGAMFMDSEGFPMAGIFAPPYPLSQFSFPSPSVGMSISPAPLTLSSFTFP